MRLSFAATVLFFSLLWGPQAAVAKDNFSTLEASPASKTISGWNFDWDDNIFFMPTSVAVFHKKSGKEKLLSTGDFAIEGKNIGKTGPYSDYEIVTNEKKNSFRFFRDDPKGKHNYFKEDLVKAISEADLPKWQGPSWDAFLFALSREDTAKKTSIITARGHSPQGILEGLKWLYGKGYIKHLPLIQNIYPVSHPTFAGAAKSTSAIKALVMQDILDDLQATPFLPGATPVMNPDGTKREPLHLWGFSDDDWGNFAKALEVLSKEVVKKRWPKVKITVFFTGLHDPKHDPQTLVIKSDGTTRRRLITEYNEGLVSTICAGN